MAKVHSSVIFCYMLTIVNQSIRQTPIFPKDVDMKMKLWYNLRRFLYEIKDIPIFKRSYRHIT